MVAPDAASRRARVEAIRARIDKMVPGRDGSEAALDDARFIGNAPDDVRWLLAELERSEALAARREEQLLELSIAVIRKEVTP